ncbi:MAG: D-aminoacyl-tRNA deacylase [Ignavibacteriales bacterium]
MRALVQRVSEGGVYIEKLGYSAEIGHGMVILLGIKADDKDEDVIFVADKCSNLRIFEDENEKMNLSIQDTGGEVLVISQFTLYGDARKGNRPNFTNAARPEIAERMYNNFVQRIKENLGDNRVQSGVFGAMMNVKILNNGPVTILVESK